jgi:hypothetical protein
VIRRSARPTRSLAVTPRVQTIVAAARASSDVFSAATKASGASALGGQVLHLPSGYPTIQAALNAAAEGDTVPHVVLNWLAKPAR